MPKKHLEPSVVNEKKLSSESEIDYSPKPEPLRVQILFGVKLFSIAGLLFLLVWLTY